MNNNGQQEASQDAQAVKTVTSEEGNAIAHTPEIQKEKKPSASHGSAQYAATPSPYRPFGSRSS